MHSDQTLLADQTFLSTYSRSTKVAILVGVPFFLFFGVMALWWLVTEDKGLAAKGVYAGMVLFFAGMGLFGVRLIPHINSSIAATSDGLHVFDKDMKETIYPWREISHFKDRQLLQVLDIYDVNGRRLVSVDYYISNFAQFRALVVQYVSAGA